MQDEMSNDPGNVETTQGTSTGRRVTKKKTSKKKPSRDLAKKLAESVKAEEEAAKPVVETNLDSDDVWYIACPHWHPAIFLREKPHGLLRDKDWWSSYKDVDAAWSFEKITCQVCGKKIRVSKAPDGFYARKHYLKKMTQARFRKLTEAEVSA